MMIPPSIKMNEAIDTHFMLVNNNQLYFSAVRNQTHNQLSEQFENEIGAVHATYRPIQQLECKQELANGTN